MKNKENQGQWKTRSWLGKLVIKPTENTELVRKISRKTYGKTRKTNGKQRKMGQMSENQRKRRNNDEKAGKLMEKNSGIPHYARLVLSSQAGFRWMMGNKMMGNRAPRLFGRLDQWETMFARLDGSHCWLMRREYLDVLYGGWARAIWYTHDSLWAVPGDGT